MSDVAQQPGPDFFWRERLAPDVPEDYGIGPHRFAIGEIVQPMAAQSETGGFQNRNFNGRTNQVGHGLPRTFRVGEIEKDPQRRAPAGPFRLAVGIGLRLSTLTGSQTSADFALGWVVVAPAADTKPAVLRGIRAEALSLSHLTWDTTMTVRYHILDQPPFQCSCKLTPWDVGVKLRVAECGDCFCSTPHTPKLALLISSVAVLKGRSLKGG